MDPEDQQRLLADVVEQIEELTLLIERPDRSRARRGAARRQPRTCASTCSSPRSSSARAGTRPRRRCTCELEPTILAGVPARLERAVSNLIDNAVKYSPPGEPVEVALRGAALTVRDHGPGHLRRGPAARLRPLLPRRRGARALRLRARPRDRPPGRRPARRQRRRRARARRRHADAPALPGRRDDGLRRRRPARRGEPLAVGAGGHSAPGGRASRRARRQLAKARRRAAVAAAERAREVRRLAVADEARDVRDRDRALLDQQLAPPAPSGARADPR